PTAASPISVSVTFSEPVTGFVSGDVVVGNASISGFSGSGASYSFNLTPLGQGTFSTDIPAGVANDLATRSSNVPVITVAGNPNTAATQLSRTFDSIAPAAPVLSSSTPATP